MEEVSRNTEFNISEFVFKGVSGSLVKRGTPKGKRYNVELIFQGADHLDVAKEFDTSAANSNPWTITHPLYGQLYVQPISLTQDNAAGNVSRFTGQLIQTILDSGLEVENSAPDAIQAMMAGVVTNLNIRIAEGVRLPETVSFVQNMLLHASGAFNAILAKIAFVQENVDSLYAYYNDANAAINNAIFKTDVAAAALTNLIVTPAVFTDKVINRITQLSGVIAVFEADVDLIATQYGKAAMELKMLFENNNGAAIAAMCSTTVTNVTNDYNYRGGVLAIITTIIAAYNRYLDKLNNLQSLTGGDLFSYIPDATSITALHNLVAYTTATLFQISAGSKQQRTLTLPYDSNLILVANDLYGMALDDSTITTLRETNRIELDELLVLKQGRVIIYYV
jgi:hypothetical protein